MEKRIKGKRKDGRARSENEVKEVTIKKEKGKFGQTAGRY